VLIEDVVYVGSLDGLLHAVDAATGTELWRFATGGEIASSVTAADGVLFVGSSDDTLYALVSDEVATPTV
jgi:outer membrane protein assembly factor BamB